MFGEGECAMAQVFAVQRGAYQLANQHHLDALSFPTGMYKCRSAFAMLRKERRTEILIGSNFAHSGTPAIGCRRAEDHIAMHGGIRQNTLVVLRKAMATFFHAVVQKLRNIFFKYKKTLKKA